MKRVIHGLALLITLSSLTAADTRWIVDSGATVNFKIKGFLGTVDGTLTIGQADLQFDADQLGASSFKVAIPVQSIRTGNRQRDEHLKASDYFDVSKFPMITFQSLSLSRKSETEFRVTGNLAIKSTTKNIAIPFWFLQTGNEATFEGTFKINRLDYGIGEKSMFMGDDVTVQIRIPVHQ